MRGDGRRAGALSCFSDTTGTLGDGVPGSLVGVAVGARAERDGSCLSAPLWCSSSTVMPLHIDEVGV